MIVIRTTTETYVPKPKPPGRIRIIMLPNGKLDTFRSRPEAAWDSQFPRDAVAEILNNRDFLYPH